MWRRWQNIIHSRFSLFFGIFLLLLFLHYSSLIKPIENLILRSLQPLQVLVYKKVNQNNKINSNPSEISKEELLAEQIKLKDQLQNLIVENAHLKTLVEESGLLAEQIKFLKERSFSAVTARVTSKATDSLSQAVIIDKGAADGLKEGLPVIIKNGIVVGKIFEVQDHSAKILLITSYDLPLSAVVQNNEQSPGIVRGSHNLALMMDFIPQFDQIEVGQSVYSSGSDQFTPAGLVIGKITEIKNEPGSLFQQAAVAPLFSQAEISILSILLP
ncbi:MAG: hypothetical protein A2233_00290 [Candidatus Kerfeldbacteria bacterium RIFOXYA2_FULL_38_24]|uniref:Cell shape-determining protein MreC n=1 Tax=Candidatus Kerfeldbacteria bacterium RIFOXYB2_FULL_38_14 TaxID=1798547 RepID=A0A1G2BA27_9BACT|nr:MAG: hypothetical protein A2233_00290 [Candidatus Kerfeldbacteria bacterium RIFOXYA2_FULL_38_24]OGY86034.1 MAG: hypothetical protein A2319_00495 [Candidatus Kerfeldbacteria bacterium RIFOXYB2_FULL_38_14]OGY90150.1 MAG: hypothetical protein A2458_04745 [Candidatus Kerfeldbacteria bacterium RIFOXYC2_FULL_38_9]